LLPLAIVACGGGGAGPRTAPAPRTSPSAAWIPQAGLDPATAQRALDGESATTLHVIGRLVADGGAVPVDLVLTRSGAMRLQATDGSGQAVVSNGSRLWVAAAGRVAEAEAWSVTVEGSGDLLGALSPFDLLEALLPAPWPLLGEERSATSTARTPEGLWLSTLTSTAAGPQTVHRRALLDPVDGRVLRRERYDHAGNLEVAIEGVAAAGGSLSIERPQQGARLTLQIDTLVRDPELAPATFARPR
jgi:hypothetical protein